MNNYYYYFIASVLLCECDIITAEMSGSLQVSAPHKQNHIVL